MQPSSQSPRRSVSRPLNSRQRVEQLRRARRQARLARLLRLWPLLLPLLLLPLFWPAGVVERLAARSVGENQAPTAILRDDMQLPAGAAVAQPPDDPVPSAGPADAAGEAAIQPLPTLMAPLATATPTFAGPTAVPGSLGRMPILMYHYVREVDPGADPLGYRLSVTPAALAAQLDWLAAQGYTTVRMDEALRCLNGGAGCPAKPVALTFDDGYADAHQQALPLLQARGMVATFYIVSGFVGQPGYMGAPEIQALHAAGMEIGAHSLSHPDLTTLGLEDARAQIAGSREQVAAIAGVPVTSFCYPAGKYTAETVTLVREAGFTNAVTTIQSDDYSDPLTLPRVRINGDVDQAGFEWLVQSNSL